MELKDTQSTMRSIFLLLNWKLNILLNDHMYLLAQISDNKIGDLNVWNLHDIKWEAYD
jgi:hypothetical protein